MKFDDIKVTVFCTAYNHGKYIRKCLDGFVTQKTNFKFIVIVHDDASTDDTAKIIKEYEMMYPQIIKCIYQKDNQYSKGVSIKRTFMNPLIKGDYIASCEGDDYWCDPNKLQKQYDFLLSHPEYSACCHNTFLFDMLYHKHHKMYGKVDKDVMLDNVLKGGGAEFHTSSLMFRREFVDCPDCFAVPGIGDFPRAIYLALNGKIRYFSDTMSVYRYGTPGSWTLRQSTNTLIKNHKNIISALGRINEYTNFVHSESFELAIRRNEYKIEIYKNDLKKIKNEYRDFYNNEKLLFKIKRNILYFFPFLLRMRKIK